MFLVLCCVRDLGGNDSSGGDYRSIQDCKVQEMVEIEIISWVMARAKVVISIQAFPGL